MTPNSNHSLQFHKSLEAIIDAPGDAYMMMIDFPMINALESQYGNGFLIAFKDRVETVIREYIEATTIKENVKLDATWMGARLAVSVANALNSANLKRLTDHLKTSIEMMGKIEFAHEAATTSIFWRTRPYLAYIKDYFAIEPDIMLQELSFMLFDLKLREMKSQNLSTGHLLPAMANQIEEWQESQGEVIEYERDLENSRKGRALELALANHEVPMIFTPVREYATGLMAAINANIGETDLLMKDPNLPDFDDQLDASKETADRIREIAAWYGIAWNLETYILQEAMAWFSGWRASPNTYYPVRLQVHLPLMLFKPGTEPEAAIERIIDHHSHIASDLIIVIEPPAKDLEDLDIKELQASLKRLAETYGVRYAISDVSLHDHFNYMQASRTDALCDHLNIRLAKLSEEWADLPANKENLGLLELMIKELTDERIEIVAPDGVSGEIHECMRMNGVYAYEEKGNDNELTPEQVEQVLRQELNLLNQGAGKNNVIFGRLGKGA